MNTFSYKFKIYNVYNIVVYYLEIELIGPPIGVSVYGMLVVDYSTVLMVSLVLPGQTKDYKISTLYLLLLR